MKGGALVSMIVPVYNKKDYLEMCVDSLRAQTYRNLEIILVDDGSTEGSGELCDVQAQEDSRIRVIHQENGGVSSARNAGLDAAQGKYICFVDADDQVLDTMVEEMAAILEENGYDLCVGGIRVLEEREASKSYSLVSSKIELFQFPAVREKQRFLCRRILYFHFGWSACSQMFRRDVIENHRLRFVPGQKIFEDVDFFFRYVACCRNLCQVSKPFYIYRQHAGSTMHTSGMREQIDWMLRLTRRWESVLQEQAPFPPAYICAGVIYLFGFANKVPKTPGDKQKLARVFDTFRSAKDGDWVLGQARLAMKNRAEVLRVCGLCLGLRVCEFYRCLLTGNVEVFYRINQLKGCYGALYDTLYKCKRKLLSFWR